MPQDSRESAVGMSGDLGVQPGGFFAGRLIESPTSAEVTLRKSITPTSLMAECETCPWSIDSGRYDADRMAARRHAIANPGHRVRVETTKAFVYAVEVDGA